jgi:putative acetyltransferase
MGLRLDEAADWPAVYDIYAAAFGQLAEAELVQRLRADGDLIFALTAYDDAPVGHIAFSTMILHDAPDIRTGVLAPVAVVPAYRKRGVGAALIRESLRRLGEAGYDLVVVLGDPAYYSRFGFEAKLAGALKTPYDGPYLQALALSPKGREAHGRVSYAKAFAELK